MHVVVASHQLLPAKGYGGPQRVVVALVRGLAALGHRVTVLAPPGTRLAEAAVVEVPARKFGDVAELARYLPRDAEILHAHFALRRAPPGELPFVQTIHRNLKPGAPLDPHTIFLSHDHARRHGSDVFVYNGLDPAEYRFRRFPKRPDQYDLFLGKLHSAKGYHWAVEAAKHTGHKLIVAGGWRPSFTGSVKYVGEVDGTQKATLLARARCVWNPAQWDEPFGLVTVEALLSGTPVLGTRRGALPELVTPATGALCDTMDQMIAAAGTIHTRSPEACRSHAQRYFTHVVMAEEYVRMYRCLIETRRLSPGRPTPGATLGRP
ncbi:MAG: glycosyltransferase [Gemmatimonadales bacterium]